MGDWKNKFPTLKDALEEIARLQKPIKGNSFWVKTVKEKSGSEVTLFRSRKEAVMSFESMEEAITQNVSIAEFKHNPNPSENEVNWTINPISWREIAKARLLIQRKKEE